MFIVILHYLLYIQRKISQADIHLFSIIAVIVLNITCLSPYSSRSWCVWHSLATLNHSSRVVMYRFFIRWEWASPNVDPQPSSHSQWLMCWCVSNISLCHDARSLERLDLPRGDSRLYGLVRLLDLGIIGKLTFNLHYLTNTVLDSFSDAFFEVYQSLTTRGVEQRRYAVSPFVGIGHVLNPIRCSANVI